MLSYTYPCLWRLSFAVLHVSMFVKAVICCLTRVHVYWGYPLLSYTYPCLWRLSFAVLHVSMFIEDILCCLTRIHVCEWYILLSYTYPCLWRLSFAVWHVSMCVSAIICCLTRIHVCVGCILYTTCPSWIIYNSNPIYTSHAISLPQSDKLSIKQFDRDHNNDIAMFAELSNIDMIWQVNRQR